MEGSDTFRKHNQLHGPLIKRAMLRHVGTIAYCSFHPYSAANIVLACVGVCLLCLEQGPVSMCSVMQQINSRMSVIHNDVFP